MICGLFKSEVSKDSSGIDKKKANNYEKMVENMRRWNFITHKLNEERVEMFLEIKDLTKGDNLDGKFHQLYLLFQNIQPHNLLVE